jgi:hypothetical protein
MMSSAEREAMAAHLNEPVWEGQCISATVTDWLRERRWGRTSLSAMGRKRTFDDAGAVVARSIAKRSLQRMSLRSVDEASTVT